MAAAEHPAGAAASASAPPGDTAVLGAGTAPVPDPEVQLRPPGAPQSPHLGAARGAGDRDGAPAYLFLRFAAAVAIGAFLWAVTLVFVLALGDPRTEAASRSSQAAWFRMLHSVMVALPSGPVAISIFAFTYELPRRLFNRYAMAISLLVLASLVLFRWTSRVATNPGAEALRATGLVLGYVAIFIIPGLLFRRRHRKREFGPGIAVSSEAQPAIRFFYVFNIAVALPSSFVAAPVWLWMWYIATVVVLITVALVKDRPDRVTGNLWYVCLLAAGTVSLSNIVGNPAVGMLEHVGDNRSSWVAFGIAVAFSVAMGYAMLIFRAIGKRALPARHISKAMYCVQVFFDFFIEGLYFASFPSVGWFGILVLQGSITILRDGGLGIDIKNAVAGAWMRVRGRQYVADEASQVLSLTSTFLQNVVSELIASSVFLGALVAEEGLADDRGAITDLGANERRRLMGGFVLVLASNLVAHWVSLRLIRRRIRRGRMGAARQGGAAAGVAASGAGAPRRNTLVAVQTGDLDMLDEANKLVRRNGTYIVSVSMLTVATGLLLIRQLRIDYRSTAEM